MPDLNLLAQNEAYIKVICDEGIERELSEHFSFYAEGFQYTPMFKKKLWDGKIRLFDRRHSVIYRGLLQQLFKFAELHEYTVGVDDALTETENFSLLPEVCNFSAGETFVTHRSSSGKWV